MLIRIGYEMVFDIPAPASMILMLYTHPERAADLRRPDRLVLEPEIRVEDFFDAFGNRCARIDAPAGKLRIANDSLVEDSGEPDAVNPAARQHPISDLPSETLQFL